MKMFFMRLFFVLFAAIFFVACASNGGHYAVLELRQDAEILPEFRPSVDKIDPARYKERFFAPWHFKGTNFTPKQLFWAFEGYLKKDYYFFNKQKIPRSFFEKAIANADTAALLSVKKLGYTTQNTPLRNLPTATPILQSPFKDGEGLPFDYALDSLLNAATPVLISHFTRDGRFAFVQSEAGWGFIETLHLREISPQQAKNYENSRFITPTAAQIPAYDERGYFAFEARLGGIYGVVALKQGVYFGELGDFKFQIAAENVANFPLKMDDKNVKKLLQALINRPYGWGGFGEERDCSALVRDIFAPFGLWLPRNSAAQNAAWSHFDVSGLDADAKTRLIARYAKPYETLLYLKGHIMLFVGVVENAALELNSNSQSAKNAALNLQNNAKNAKNSALNSQNSVKGSKNSASQREFDPKTMQIVAFHSIWGVRTKDDGRLLIGKSALTPLDIGSGDSRVKSEDLLISRIESISFLSLNSSEKKAIEKAVKSGLKQ